MKITRQIIIKLVETAILSFLIVIFTGTIYSLEREIEIKVGDTLYKIAREKLGDAKRWNEIAALNGIEAPYNIKVGDKLLLPQINESHIDVSNGLMRAAAENSSSPLSETAPLSPIKETTDINNQTNRNFNVSSNLHQSEISDTELTDTNIQKITSLKPSFVPTFVEPLGPLITGLRAHNPSIHAAEEAARAASYRPSQAGSLPDPMLRTTMRFDQQREVMIDNTGMVSVRTERMTMPMFQISQMIPLGKLGPMSNLERAMAGTYLEMTSMERATKERQLKTAYAELYYIDQAARTCLQIREVLKLLVASTEAMYRVGEARQSDVFRAQLEISMLSDRLLMLEGRRGATVSTINALLDRSESERVGTPESLATYRIDETELTDSSPAVRVAAAEVEAARSKIAVAQSMFIPDIELMGGTMIRPNLDPRWEIGVGISLPIWSRTKQTPALREAETKLREAEARLRAARADVREKIGAA
ncbi:TPA: hypothetical protein DEF17_04355, partial [bacterium]|nr:hypothetical protein [bacterium]